MTKKQVEELLKKGAYGALMEDDADSAKYEYVGILLHSGSDTFPCFQIL